MPDTVKYRQRKLFEAFRWTGDRAALRAWIASLPTPITIHDCGPLGDTVDGPDVLFNWAAIAADPKDPLDQPERAYGDRIERGQWIVMRETSTWVNGRVLVGMSYTDEAFRALFEEVSSGPVVPTSGPSPAALDGFANALAAAFPRRPGA